MKKTQYAYTSGGITIYDLSTGQPHHFETNGQHYHTIIENLDNDEYLFDLITRGVDQVFLEEIATSKIDIENDCLHIAGNEVRGFLVDRWIDIKVNGGDVTAYEEFIKNLEQNPSSQSVTELVDFLGHKGFPITDDGCFLAYKGIREDDYSVRGNKQTVVLQGQTDSTGHILHTVGSTIEIARNSCDDDRSEGCSHGLHTGTWEYASNWGQKLVLVKVNPKDVVSVPLCCDCQKLRCCKYVVETIYLDPQRIEATTAKVVDTELVEMTVRVNVLNIVRDVLNEYPRVNGVDDLISYISDDYDISINRPQFFKAIEEIGHSVTTDHCQIIRR